MAEEQQREPWQDMVSTKEELIAILWRMRADIERFAAEPVRSVWRCRAWRAIGA